MVTVRTAKSKGSQFEYDCQYSLSKIYPEIYRTSERGFQMQYDLECESHVFECKRLKGISWNQLVKLYLKLKRKTDKIPIILFKSNRQPCLVFYETYSVNIYRICTFEDMFHTPFEKHPSTRGETKKITGDIISPKIIRKWAEELKNE